MYTDVVSNDLNSLISSSSSWVEDCLGFSTHAAKLSLIKDRFTSSFPIIMCFFILPYGSGCSIHYKVEWKWGEWTSFLAPDTRGKYCIILPVCMMIVVGFSEMYFIRVRRFSSITECWVYNEFMLNFLNFFSSYILLCWIILNDLHIIKQPCTFGINTIWSRFINLVPYCSWELLVWFSFLLISYLVLTSDQYSLQEMSCKMPLLPAKLHV